MTASIPVSLFNATTFGVTIQVNAATDTVWLGSTSGGMNWEPQYNCSQVTMTLAGPTAPNVLAPAQNFVGITPDFATEPHVVTIDLTAFHQWYSLQLYVFFNSDKDFSWLVLNNGNYVTGAPG